MWWESVLLTMESTTFPSGKWTWILSAGTLYRCKASVLHQLLLRTDHSRQVPDGHQQQHQHHHLLLGRQAVQGGAALHDLLQAVRGPASGRSNSNQSTFKHWTLILILQFPSSTNSQQQRKDTNGISCVTQSTRANGEVHIWYKILQNTPWLGRRPFLLLIVNCSWVLPCPIPLGVFWEACVCVSISLFWDVRSFSEFSQEKFLCTLQSCKVI